MKPSRFKDLTIGQEFVFLSEVSPMFAAGGLQTGPWRKISPRKYVHTQDCLEHTVGSINVEVSTTKVISCDDVKCEGCHGRRYSRHFQ